jgi:hypothetical protein
MAAKEISGLALQHGNADRPPPRKHVDGAEKALKVPSREIKPMALEQGGASTTHPQSDPPGGPRKPESPRLKAAPPLPKAKPMAEHFDKMVDMRRTAADRAAENLPFISDNRNHAMTLTLAGPELAKIDRDADVEPGTILHFCCMAQVKEVHRGSTESLVVEVIKMAVENEDEEDQESMSDEDRIQNRYGDDEEEHD